MTEQREFLRKMVEFLEESSIPYMLSGSMGSGLHGFLRTTNDADLVIDPTREQLLSFVDLFGPDYYISKDAALQAFADNTMFNVIEIKYSWKADFIIRKKRSFSEMEFSRRIRASFMGVDVDVVSPEDSILSKLEWSKDSQSKTQLEDISNILKVQWDSMDFEYLRKWAKELKVEDSLEQLIEDVGELK
jgi:predicted nucleotidyltransferase